MEEPPMTPSTAGLAAMFSMPIVGRTFSGSTLSWGHPKRTEIILDTIKDLSSAGDAIGLDNKVLTKVGKGMPSKTVQL
jgi:hypothetical protein